MGIKGSKKLKLELSETGRLKPFYASTYSAFLIWANKYKKEILVYTSSKKINKKMFNLMIKYEKIPREKQKKYKKQAKELLKKRNKKFVKKIKKLKNPIKKLNELLEKGYQVAFLISDYYLKRPRKPAPHWIVAYKKDDEQYYFMDSATGKLKLTKKQLQKGLKLNKKQGFVPQLITYKK